MGKLNKEGLTGPLFLGIKEIVKRREDAIVYKHHLYKIISRKR